MRTTPILTQNHEALMRVAGMWFVLWLETRLIIARGKKKNLGLVKRGLWSRLRADQPLSCKTALATQTKYMNIYSSMNNIQTCCTYLPAVPLFKQKREWFCHVSLFLQKSDVVMYRKIWKVPLFFKHFPTFVPFSEIWKLASMIVCLKRPGTT